MAMCILLFIDKNPLLQPDFVLVMWFCVLLFSVPMALLFASWKKIEIIKFGKLKESDVGYKIIRNNYMEKEKSFFVEISKNRLDNSSAFSYNIYGNGY